MTIKATLAAFCLTSIAASTALAAVTADQAARLGKDLTPIGAEMAGNADGSIPPWDPKGTPVPENFVAGSDNYVNPYPDEKPLYTIDNANWKQYADELTQAPRHSLKNTARRDSSSMYTLRTAAPCGQTGTTPIHSRMPPARP